MFGTFELKLGHLLFHHPPIHTRLPFGQPLGGNIVQQPFVQVRHLRRRHDLKEKLPVTERLLAKLRGLRRQDGNNYPLY